MVRVLYAKKGICPCSCSSDDFAVHLCTARGVKSNVAKTQAHASVCNGVPQLRTGCGLLAPRDRAGIAGYRASRPHGRHGHRRRHLLRLGHRNHHDSAPLVAESRSKGQGTAPKAFVGPAFCAGPITLYSDRNRYAVVFPATRRDSMTSKYSFAFDASAATLHLRRATGVPASSRRRVAALASFSFVPV